MAKDPPDTDREVKRSARRTLTNFTLFLILLGVLAGWGSLGAFTLKPGEAAVLLFLGKHDETITKDGLHLRLPPPLVTRDIVNYDELRNEDFGFDGRDEGNVPPGKVIEATMQTSDNNIVLVAFAVQYQINDAFYYHYRIANPAEMVRDAEQGRARRGRFLELEESPAASATLLVRVPPKAPVAAAAKKYVRTSRRPNLASTISRKGRLSVELALKSSSSSTSIGSYL